MDLFLAILWFVDRKARGPGSEGQKLHILSSFYEAKQQNHPFFSLDFFFWKNIEFFFDDVIIDFVSKNIFKAPTIKGKQ